MLMSNSELIDQIKRLKSKDVAFVIGLFIAVLAPGFLTLYLFQPEAIAGYDTIKVIIFSAALTLPVFSFNLLVTGIASTESLHEDQFGPWIMSSLLTTLTFYPALLASYIYNLRFIAFLALLASIGLFLLLTAVAAINRREKTPRKAKD